MVFGLATQRMGFRGAANHVSTRRCAYNILYLDGREQQNSAKGSRERRSTAARGRSVGEPGGAEEEHSCGSARRSWGGAWRRGVEGKRRHRRRGAGEETRSGDSEMGEDGLGAILVPRAGPKYVSLALENMAKA